MCVCVCTPVSFIKNPSQVTFAFPDTRFPDVYNDAFETGVTWDANWMPGGPHVYTGTKLPELRERDEAKYRTWHEGFNAGLKLRLETNAHFAAWWDENRKRGGHLRYDEPECIVAEC